MSSNSLIKQLTTKEFRMLTIKEAKIQNLEKWVSNLSWYPIPNGPDSLTSLKNHVNKSQNTSYDMIEFIEEYSIVNVKDVTPLPHNSHYYCYDTKEEAIREIKLLLIKKITEKLDSDMEKIHNFLDALTTCKKHDWKFHDADQTSTTYKCQKCHKQYMTFDDDDD